MVVFKYEYTDHLTHSLALSLSLSLNLISLICPVSRVSRCLQSVESLLKLCAMETLKQWPCIPGTWWFAIASSWPRIKHNEAQQAHKTPPGFWRIPPSKVGIVWAAGSSLRMCRCFMYFRSSQNCFICAPYRDMVALILARPEASRSTPWTSFGHIWTPWWDLITTTAVPKVTSILVPCAQVLQVSHWGLEEEEIWKEYALCITMYCFEKELVILSNSESFWGIVSHSESFWVLFSTLILPEKFNRICAKSFAVMCPTMDEKATWRHHLNAIFARVLRNFAEYRYIYIYIHAYILHHITVNYMVSV